MQKRSVFNLLIMAPILSGIVLSFQNCSPVNFSTLASESSIDLLGVCEVDPSLPQCSDPEPKSPQKCTFNGKEYSEGETVKAFLSSTVAAGQVCVSEDRRCVNGAFTGSYLYATCAVDAPASCLFNGITVPHGDTIEAFENPSVPYNANCVAEMRRCNNGVLGGTYEHLKCEPVAASFAWASSPQGSCSATPSYNYGAWSACGSNGQQTRTSSCVNTS
ncbi:MAG: hypothetical protein HUU57_03140, partial [Bdellovibrio sp.]|nr:hypothetical protein [Bdellovibrio sp.]